MLEVGQVLVLELSTPEVHNLNGTKVFGTYLVHLNLNILVVRWSPTKMNRRRPHVLDEQGRNRSDRKIFNKLLKYYFVLIRKNGKKKQ